MKSQRESTCGVNIHGLDSESFLLPEQEGCQAMEEKVVGCEKEHILKVREQTE
jgi:hypothetical protein